MSNLSDSKRKKRIEEIIKNFRPIDDTFLSFLIQSDNSIVEYILRVIMNMSSLKVIEVHSQDYVKNIFGRSACFDILAKDENDKIYNIEIQRSNAGAIYKRARFNSSMLDIKSIEAGQNLDSLKETYVIFITENDVIGYNLPIYHINRTVEENGTIFKDDSHIIYVNSSYQDLNTELGRLMHDFYCNKPDDMLCLPIKQAVKKVKETKEGNKQMCEIAEELIAEGRIEGKAEGRAEANAENKEQFTNILKDKFGLSHEEAVKLIEDSFKASNMSV